VVKNKIAPPFKEAEFDIMYGEGISKVGELVDMGVKFGFVQKAGAWFALGDTRLGQGRDAAKQYFRENPEVADEIERKIKEKLTGKEQAAPEPKTPTKTAVKATPKADRPRASVEVFADDFEDD
jgi:recombination protein RecA